MGDRIDVRSADGVSLAVWVDGVGPPLVMVHGAMSDHTSDSALASELGRHFTTYAMDRRGRGGSGDSGPYSIDREFADVAAVVDAAATHAGGTVVVWAHSFGADCAMGGADLSSTISHLILYEPGLGMTYPAGSVEAVEAALAAGDLEGAAVALLVRVVEMNEEEVATLRASNTWQTRLELVPTVSRELIAESGWTYRPGQFAGITAAALLLAGSESPPAQAAATRAAASAIRGAEIRILPGHSHIAHRTHPERVAGIVREFAASLFPPVST